MKNKNKNKHERKNKNHESKQKKERGKKGDEGIHEILKHLRGIKHNFKNIRVHDRILKTKGHLRNFENS